MSARALVRLFIALAFALASQVCTGQGPVAMTIRVVALNGDGKPVEGLTSTDITATAAGKPVTILQLSSSVGSEASRGGRSDNLVYLFPPLQANVTAQRAKAIEPVSGLLNPTITIVSGDGARVTGPASSAQIKASIDRMTGKRVVMGSFVQWQPVAKTAVRVAARATGRCIVVLNDSRRYLPPNTTGYDMTSIGADASNHGCELYVVEDSADMPSQIPPTVGQVRHGQVLDASGQLVDVGIGVAPLPLSASGEQITYSMKSARRSMERTAAGVYWAELAAPAACQRSPGCPLHLSTKRKNVSLHSPRQLGPLRSRQRSSASASAGE